MVVLYLSDNKIQIAVGNLGMKAQVNKCIESDEIQGMMLNGNILKRDEFCELIKRIFDDNDIPKKDVCLLLNSSQIITKVIKMPVKDSRKAMNYIANEFADIERTPEPVYAYSMIKEDKKSGLNTVLAFVADKTYLEDFVETFKECGIRIKSVEASLSSGVRVISKINGIKNKTAVVEFKERDGVLNVLFIDGNYSYSSFTKINCEAGVEKFGEEIANSIYNIIQFTEAQQIDNGIQSIMFSGFSEEEKESAKNVIASISNEISVGTLSRSPVVSFKESKWQFSDFVYPSGGLIEDKKTVNLLGNIKKSGKDGVPKSSMKGLAIIAIIICVIVVSASAVLLAVSVGKKGELNDIKKYNTSPEAVEQMTQYTNLVQKKQDVKKRQNAVEEYESFVNTYPLPNDKVRLVIEECAVGYCTVETMAYNSVTGEYTVSALANKAHDIHKFIRAMEKKKKILTIQEYSGYEYIEETAKWSVNVVIVLTSKAGK